ncbi:olfactory receptor 6N2-like [Pholidichthys leucotaenia]
MENNSEILFVLQGLNDTLTNRQIYFALALVSYLFTLFLNLTLIITICVDKTLHEPIYIFLCSLCFNGIWGASSFYPKLLHDLLVEAPVITYVACLSQMFFMYSYVLCEFTSLTVMAYDCYLAICRPLQYRVLMTLQKVVKLLLLTWCFSLLEIAVGFTLTSKLPLCGRHIPKIFCTNWEVVKLSCSDTTLNDIYGYILMLSFLVETGFIVVSYAYLIRASVRSHASRKKFVQTCLPHLITLLIFAYSILFDNMYSRYGGGIQGALKNALAAEFLVVPPLINPIIYGMNLQQIRTRILHRFPIRVKWHSLTNIINNKN